MTFLFWIITLILNLIAVAILIPWLAPWLVFWLVPSHKFSTSHECKTLHSKTMLIFIFIVIPLFSYAFYYSFGSSQHLKAYYSLDDQKNREQMQRIRPLMAELKKQEFRLRFHLEENPKDVLVQSQLLELLAIQALQAGDLNLAKQFLMKALEVLPENSDDLPRRNHIRGLLKSW